MGEKLRREEFAALRATIRERGTVRVITFLVALVAWATLDAWALTSGPRDAGPILVTLMVLLAGFETVFHLHVGIERVGRYLQAAYEEQLPGPVGPRWETTAMAYGRAYPDGGSDPLFTRVFILATLLNVLPALRAWRSPGLFAVLLGLHLLFIVRIGVARAVASAQRATDLERFRVLTHEAPPVPSAEAPVTAQASEEPGVGSDDRHGGSA